jgi:hypothetical protein
LRKIIVFAALVFVALITGCDNGDYIQLQFEEPCQFIITAKDGTRILVDVINPDMINPPPTAGDILLVTHLHTDHYNADFVNSFPGEKIISKTGNIKRKNISITSFASAHIDTDPISADKATNYLFYIEVDDFRIIHGGAYGQVGLTPEQKQAIGSGVDIAVMQIENSFSNLTIGNKRAFDLIKEMNPGLNILSHFKDKTLEYAIKNYHVWSRDEKPFKIYKNKIPHKTEFLLLGKTAPAYESIYNLKHWP